jgi:hypothetical protein
VRGWLKAETYFTAEEALAAGLITEILPAAKLAAAAHPLIHASALPAKAPAALRQLLAATTEENHPMPEPKPKAGAEPDPGATATPSPEAIAAAVRDALPTALGEILPDLVAKAVGPAITAALAPEPKPEPAPASPKPEPAIPAAVQAQVDALTAANKARDEREKVRDEEAKTLRIKAALDTAVLEGRMPPSLRAAYEGGLKAAATVEAFDKLVEEVKAMPVVVSRGSHALRAALVDGDGAEAGLDYQSVIARFDGADPDQFAPNDLRILAMADKAERECTGDAAAKADARRRAIFAAAGEPLTAYGSN